jgi:D-threo-aldose 1-dehydrogenase
MTPPRRLGGSAVAASPLGNLYRTIDDDTAAATTVAAAIRLGIAYFDTAPHYGLGLADRRLGDALDEALPAPAELRDDGIVGAIGAGMNSAPGLTRRVETGLVDVVLLAGRYTLLEQTALDDLLPAAQASGTSVVVGGVFNSGLLARPTVDDRARYNYQQAPPELLERARRLADVCCRHGTSLPQAAVQFPLAHPAVVPVLVGAERPEQLVEDVGTSAPPSPRSCGANSSTRACCVPTPTSLAT